jgi:hypothetical protein
MDQSFTPPISLTLVFSVHYEGPDAHFRTLCLKRLDVISDADAVAAIDAEIHRKYQTVGAVLMFSLNSFDQVCVCVCVCVCVRA